MKKNFINRLFIEGRLYQHNLTIKQVQNKDSANFGKDFISGTIDIATDEEGLNVISIHYTYVTAVTNSGKQNATFNVLNAIINGAKTWVVDGKDAALKLRATPALALNDFYTNDDELVSAKRNEGGFVNTISELVPENERNRFDLDLLITSVRSVEPEDGQGHLVLKGAAFNFKGDLLPVELICRHPDGMAYFESIDASPSNPIFTEVKGAITNTTVKREIEEESAFGAASVKTVTRTTREYAVDWARPTEYTFGEEDTITAEELKKAIQDREVYLAGIKKRRDDWAASQKNNESNSANASIPVGGFSF